MQPRDRIRTALARDLNAGAQTALVAGITAGYPEPKDFLKTLRAMSGAADVVEICVPFSDPMADGVTIQRSSQHAIEKGVTLSWILDELARRDFELAPVVLMSYLNPLLAYGYEALAKRAAEVGVNGFIVPDLPYEESAPLAAAFAPHGLALVQLVTPATPPERLNRLCAASQGFVYAVTRTGITGGESTLPPETASYLAAVRAASPLPVCAGFGVRRSDQVKAIGKHVDGVIVASALIEALERGADPGTFLRSLRV